MLASALATAVLTGALLVGDSVRGSLRDLTLERLGKIDHALVAQRFFREKLGADLAADPGFLVSFEGIVPAILLNGSATAAYTHRRASRVQVAGVDEAFASLGGSEQTAVRVLDFLRRNPDQNFAPVVLNQSLQREMQVVVGDHILLSFERQSDIRRESVYGRKKFRRRGPDSQTHSGRSRPRPWTWPIGSPSPSGPCRSMPMSRSPICKRRWSRRGA